MWGKADTIDHHRDLGQSELGRADEGRHRPLKPPGTFWEYNDVRVNRLSLCLLQLFRRPLADVLREAVMDPIGASDDWAWQPYDNSWIECDGRRLPSVPGGSHWGGGLWMSTLDHAAARASRPAAGAMGPATPARRGLAGGVAHAVPGQSPVRIAVVAEYGMRTVSGRAGDRLRRARRGKQRDRHRSRARSAGGGAVDRPGEPSRVHPLPDGERRHRLASIFTDRDGTNEPAADAPAMPRGVTSILFGSS
jgi:CubicO group peptidase (beta-lactamase class C family)